MPKKRYKPQIDKLFFIIWIPTGLLMLAVTLIPAISEPKTLLWTLPTDLFVFYFLLSSLFGYVELREETLFVKFGFFLRREIPYAKIRGMQKIRKWYSDSMLSLKNSMEHVNIKYNTFDFISVSVKDNDLFIYELQSRL